MFAFEHSHSLCGKQLECLPYSVILPRSLECGRIPGAQCPPGSCCVLVHVLSENIIRGDLTGISLVCNENSGNRLTVLPEGGLCSAVWWYFKLWTIVPQGLPLRLVRVDDSSREPPLSFCVVHYFLLGEEPSVRLQRRVRLSGDFSYRFRWTSPRSNGC